ncbi:KTSC domain-containing protein [Paenibacillus sp. ACRRX]|uniref:KTSC domain-containing protein n=2 Tax=unclassified Paenibacillus TaxID=185978 RepID=UPI001EF4A259
MKHYKLERGVCTMPLNVLFVPSKQISYLLYDETTSELVAQYATGETKSYRSVPASWFRQLQLSDNRYDDFVELTQRIVKAPQT